MNARRLRSGPAALLLLVALPTPAHAQGSISPTTIHQRRVTLTGALHQA